MRHAFLWKDGIMYDLNNLISSQFGLTLVWASDINNKGEIVGFGTLSNGDYHGFLLQPKVVPEPASMLLFGIGGLAMVTLKRKKLV